MLQISVYFKNTSSEPSFQGRYYKVTERVENILVESITRNDNDIPKLLIAKISIPKLLLS